MPLIDGNEMGRKSGLRVVVLLGVVEVHWVANGYAPPASSRSLWTWHRAYVKVDYFFLVEKLTMSNECLE